MKSFRTHFDHIDKKIHHFDQNHPFARAPNEGVVLVKMVYFLVNMVEMSSETFHSASNSTANGLTMLERSEIDDYGE